MKNRFLLSMFLCFMVAVVSVAQTTVKGVVTGPDKAPIIGASVVLKGTTEGTATDENGSYEIRFVKDAILVISSIGYKSQEVKLEANKTNYSVELAEDAAVLGDVVVVAQGLVRDKRALGYSQTSVDEKAIRDRPQSDAMRSLQGKVAGVNITSTSGVTGTGTNITIRGYSSITGSVQPLFVVDGIPFNSSTNTRTGQNNSGFTQGNQTSSSRFLDLDPNNIESISILKGLAATVTYGDQGRNGVILITTKNGSKKRKAEFNVTQSYFVSEAHLPRYQDDYVGGFQQNLGYFFSNWGPTLKEAAAYPSQNTNSALTAHPYAFLSNPALRAGQAPYVAGLGAYKMQVFPNNVSDFFQPGTLSTTALNISGGTEKVGYTAAVSYTDEKGYIPNNGLKRFNAGIGLNAQLADKLIMRSTFNFVNTDQFSPPLSAGQGNNANDFPSVLANVMYTPRQVDLMGWPMEDPDTKETVYFRSGNDIPNPRWILKNYKTTGVVNRIYASTNATYELAKDMTLLYKVGFDTYDETQEFQLNKGGTVVPTGLYNTFNVKNTIWDNSLILNYSKEFTKNFALSGRIGGNTRNDKFFRYNIFSENQLARDLFRHDNFVSNVGYNNTTEETRAGVFGELSADVNNYLYLNVAGRNDWTSTVEADNRRIFYPSASVSFIPTTAIPSLESNFLSFLKLRAGIGTSAGFPQPYRTRNFLAQETRAFTNSSGLPIQTHSLDNVLANKNLRPELHTEVEFGAEGKLFKGRIGFDVTVYRRTTKDLITSAPLDPATGYTATTINIGQIRNEGIEIALNTKIMERKDFTWNANIAFSRNIPKVIDLGGSLKEVQITGFGAALGNYAVVGRPFNMIKGTGYRRNDQGQLLVGGDGYLLSTAAPIELGDPNPAFISSLNNSITYKGWTLDVLVSYRHGGAMYSALTGSMMGRGLTYDTGLEAGYDRAQTYIFPGVKASDGKPNDIQITASDVGFNNLYFFGDEGRVFNATTIRLQEVSLSYQVPASFLAKARIKGLTLAVTGNNLWYLAPYFPRGVNFDTDNLGLGVGNGLGFEFLTGPSTRRIGGTIRLTF